MTPPSIAPRTATATTNASTSPRCAACAPRRPEPPLLEEALAVVEELRPGQCRDQGTRHRGRRDRRTRSALPARPAALARLLLVLRQRHHRAARGAADPHASRHPLRGETCEAALARRRAGRALLHLPHADLSPARVITTHAAGLRVGVYTVNEVEAIAACAAWGVDYLFTDYPDRAREILAQPASS